MSKVRKRSGRFMMSSRHKQDQQWILRRWERKPHAPQAQDGFTEVQGEERPEGRLWRGTSSRESLPPCSDSSPPWGVL